MASNTLDARDVADLLRVQIGLSNQVIFHVTEHETIVSIAIDEVASSLDIVELCFAKASLFVASFACAYLFNELIGLSVDDQITIVG